MNSSSRSSHPICVHPRGGSRYALQAINPATGKTLATYKEMPFDEVRNIIDKAHNAYLDWRRTSFRSRAALMRQAAQVLRSNAAEYAHLMAEEMG